MKSWHPRLFLLAFAYQFNSGQACPPNWRKEPGSKNCFTLTNKYDTWNGSRYTCQEMGGDLASIGSKKTQKFVQTLIEPTELAWLGAYEDEDGTIKWIDGAHFGYSNWYRGTPGHKPQSRREAVASPTEFPQHCVLLVPPFAMVFTGAEGLVDAMKKKTIV